MSTFPYLLKLIIQCSPNVQKTKIHNINVQYVWLTYFMGCIKKASFLYFKLLQHESVIPIKAISERRPVFFQAPQGLTISAPASTPHFCFHAPQCRSTKRATKWGWERFWQRMPLFRGIPQRCPRMRPQASLGCWPDPGNSGGWHRGREPMSLGCLQCCYMTPSHWAAVSIPADIRFDWKSCLIVRGPTGMKGAFS